MLEQIERDIKTALLGGNKATVDILKNIKTAIQYEAVAKSLKSTDLNDDQIQTVIAREAKKRAEAAELYKNAGEQERADKELAEKAVIDKYLPAQMDEQAVAALVDEEIAKISNPTPAAMGQIIGAVKARTKGAADGALIAKLVKQKLEQG